MSCYINIGLAGSRLIWTAVILSGVIFVIACVALYAGAVMLLFAPGYPGESYFAPKRMLYGIPPTLLSITLLVTVGWLWTRSGSAISLRRAITSSFLWAIGILTFSGIVAVIIGGIRQGNW